MQQLSWKIQRCLCVECYFCWQKAQSKKGKAAEKSPLDEQPPTPVAGGKRDAATINQDIAAQGDKIRQLKAEKAAKVSLGENVIYM